MRLKARQLGAYVSDINGAFSDSLTATKRKQLDPKSRQGQLPTQCSRNEINRQLGLNTEYEKVTVVKKERRNAHSYSERVRCCKYSQIHIQMIYC